MITDAEIEWSTSDSSVATVSKGVVTSVGYGSCVINASYGYATASCTVRNPNPNPLLSISTNELILDNIGTKSFIYATSDTGEDISSIVSWSTSNSSIATCDDGEIHAIGYGSCTVTAQYQNKIATCIVTVNDPTMPAVTLSNTELKMKHGESYTLTAELSNNAGAIINWKSSDPEVATCENGIITAKSKGQCAIVAISEFGYTDICLVTVDDYVNKMGHAEYLDFDFPDFGKELKCIDKKTGQLISSAVVICHKTSTILLSDGRLVVEITLICVKTYDRDGAQGTNPTYVTSTLYRENDVFCDRKQYKNSDATVGDSFTLKCSGFTVQTRTDGTLRELYMTFASITEN